MLESDHKFAYHNLKSLDESVYPNPQLSLGVVPYMGVPKTMMCLTCSVDVHKIMMSVIPYHKDSQCLE